MVQPSPEEVVAFTDNFQRNNRVSARPGEAWSEGASQKPDIGMLRKMLNEAVPGNQLQVDPHPGWIVVLKVYATVYDSTKDVGQSQAPGRVVKQIPARRILRPYDDGPVKLGVDLAMVSGEISKEVWNLTKPEDQEEETKPKQG